MARYNGVIAAPRDVLGSVPGVELREMEKSGKNTFCCGAGGGRMWMEETRGTRINAERTRQALETGAETVATSCPFCMVMLKDGLADAASTAPPGSGTVTARDIAEILADSTRPDPAGGSSAHGPAVDEVVRFRTSPQVTSVPRGTPNSDSDLGRSCSAEREFGRRFVIGALGRARRAILSPVSVPCS